MNVGELRAFMLQIDSTDIPDDAPVLISGRHSMHATRAVLIPIQPINKYGQAQMDCGEEPNLLALVFQDASTG